MVLLPRLATFAEAYPDIVLDVVTVTGAVDLVAGEYDAGIQLVPASFCITRTGTISQPRYPRS